MLRLRPTTHKVNWRPILKLELNFLENYEQLLKKVIAIFKPGKMNVTIMANEVQFFTVFNRKQYFRNQ